MPDNNRKWEYGVYMKPNGKLVSLEKSGDDRNYWLTDGRRAKGLQGRILKALGVSDLLGCTCDSLGWGPTSYMNNAEYLGEL